jgi:hypothetical protein
MAARVRPCENAIVQTGDVPPEQRAWIERSEALWRRAYRLAKEHPELDVGDLYHVLYTWHESPSQRLKRALSHARLRVHSS